MRRRFRSARRRFTRRNRPYGIARRTAGWGSLRRLHRDPVSSKMAVKWRHIRPTHQLIGLLLFVRRIHRNREEFRRRFFGFGGSRNFWIKEGTGEIHFVVRYSLLPESLETTPSTGEGDRYSNLHWPAICTMLRIVGARRGRLCSQCQGRRRKGKWVDVQLLCPLFEL